MAPLRCAAKFDPFLFLDCAPTPSALAQSKERKGSNFAIWQPCLLKDEVYGDNKSKERAEQELEKLRKTIDDKEMELKKIKPKYEEMKTKEDSCTR